MLQQDPRRRPPIEQILALESCQNAFMDILGYNSEDEGDEEVTNGRDEKSDGSKSSNILQPNDSSDHRIRPQ
eukprot:1201415-Amorphochlora_amoeboformis.AAC.3